MNEENKCSIRGKNKWTDTVNAKKILFINLKLENSEWNSDIESVWEK